MGRGRRLPSSCHSWAFWALAALVGPVFVSDFWRGNGHGALAAMAGRFCTSGYLLVWTDAGWVVGPLVGCVVSTALYVGVSVVTSDNAPRQAVA